MTGAGRTANVLGALALAVTDQTAGAVLAATGRSGSAVSALSALAEFLDRPTLDELRTVLGLTPSGVVRLVDRLADAGLVSRAPGTDGRSRTLLLTEAGRQVAQQISAARSVALAGLVEGLTEQELDSLHGFLGRVMAAVVQVKDGGAWVCRQCDLVACGRPTGLCPAANAAQEKYTNRS